MSVGLDIAASLVAGGPSPTPAVAEESPTGLPRQVVERRVVSCPSLEVVLKSGSAALVRQVQGIFSGPAVPGEPDGPRPGHALRLVYEVSGHDGKCGCPPMYRVRLNGQDLFQARSGDELLYRLEGSITDKLMRSLSRWHLFHAGAVACNGQGILLPGPSGAGKSTTVAALALSGFDYCSDEVAVVGDDALLRPFPKVLSLKLGGWRRVAQDFPGVAPSSLVSEPARSGTWYVRPPRLPDAGRARRGYPIRFVVLPTYDPLKETSLQPLPRSLALTRLVEQCMDLSIWGTQGFDLIVRLVQRADCYAMNIGSLARAAAVLEKLTR